MSNSEKLKAALIEIPICSVDYPACFRELSNPPEALYALGDISLLQEKIFVAVGSRRTPTNILKLSAEIAKGLSEVFVLATGVADGGDSAIIEGALAGSGRIICMLAGGFSALPQSNLELLRKVAKRGLLLSPHPFETSVRSFSYEYRNELLAKLSCGVLVLSAGEKSGALITAKHAKKYRKPTFALPYPPNSEAGAGCNKLIKEGARLVENAGDIAVYYGVTLSEKKRAVELTREEEAALAALVELHEAHANELAQKTGIPPFKIRAVLSALEVKGLAVSLGGNRYSVG